MQLHCGLFLSPSVLAVSQHNQNNNSQCLDVIQHTLTECLPNKTTQFSWVIFLFVEDSDSPSCGFIRILNKNLTFRTSLCKWKDGKVLVSNYSLPDTAALEQFLASLDLWEQDGFDFRNFRGLNSQLLESQRGWSEQPSGSRTPAKSPAR